MTARRGIGLLGGIFIVGLLLLIIGFGLYYFVIYKPAQIPPTPITGYKYTKNLEAQFKIYDTTARAMITSDVNPEFYSTTDNPFAYNFTGTPITSASYDSVSGAWEALLDSGNYKLLVTDVGASPTKYPELVTVTVPGTNSEDQVVRTDPGTIKMVQRASVSISTSILAYNTASGAYDTSVTNINITSYDKWLVTITFTTAGNDKEIKPGRIYFSEITNLIPSKAFLDGKQVPVQKDTEASDDGITGYFVAFENSWKGGEIHRLDIYFEEIGTANTGTITITLFDYYAVLNPHLRWWTEETASISVVS